MRLSFAFLAAVVLVGAASSGGSAADDAVTAARPLWQRLQGSADDRDALANLLKTQAQAEDEEARALEASLREASSEAFCAGVEQINDAVERDASLQGTWDGLVSDRLTPLQGDFSEDQLSEVEEAIGDVLRWLEGDGRPIVRESWLACKNAEIKKSGF